MTARTPAHTVAPPAATLIAARAGTSPSVPRAMPAYRKWTVYGVLAFILGGHAYDIARQQEHWPFSNYPMWSRPITSWELAPYRMVGVTDEPTPREVPLVRAYAEPVPSTFMALHLARVVSDGRGNPSKHLAPDLTRARQFTADYLARYEQLRQAKAHDGPKLRGLRVYEDFWRMNTAASNARTPDVTTLLFDTDHPDAPMPPSPIGGAAGATTSTDKPASGKEAGRGDLE